MKNIRYLHKNFYSIICLLLIVISTISLAGCVPHKLDNNDYLRLHIRANSNSDSDQAIKYEVRNAVVKYLTPIIASCDTKQDMIIAVNSRITQIEKIADNVLKQGNMTYTSHMELRKEHFPTRTYDGCTLPSDVYDALIIELGTGTGNNWWCVVYPPLCFVGNQGIDTTSFRYKSKIMEIIRKFFG